MKQVALPTPLGTLQASSRVSRIAASGITWLVRTIEVTTAALIVAEFALMLLTVFMRYCVHQPLVWADELAGIGLLWLAMLSAALAVHRGEHMRVTALVARFPRLGGFFESTAAMTMVLFLVLILLPAHEHTLDEAIITTAALEISQSWKAAALEVALWLMTILCVGRMLVQSSARNLVASALLIGVVAGGFWLSSGFLVDIGNYSLIIFFLCLVGVAIAMAVPISFAFGIATVAYIACTQSVPMSVVVDRLEEGMSHQMLLAVPLFIVLGLLLEITGMARAMIVALSMLVGRVRGGLSYVLIAAIFLISGISGSKAADIAAVAPALFPEMKRRGADTHEAAALMAASAAMSETIPPSLVLITLGAVAGVSIGALFTGGLIPALILAAALSLVVWLSSRRLPKQAERFEPRKTMSAIFVALPALALHFVIRTAVVEGVATTTEVASLGIVYCLAAGIAFYGRFELRLLYPMLKKTASLTGAIMFVLGAATAMSWALSQSGFSQQLVVVARQVPGGAMGFLALSAVAFIALGALLEGIPALVLFAPLMLPAARAVGLNDVHYSMVVVLAMGIGLFTPPLGVGFFMTCAISGVDPNASMRRVWKYLGALVAGLLLVMFVPWLSTCLLK